MDLAGLFPHSVQEPRRIHLADDAEAALDEPAARIRRHVEAVGGVDEGLPESPAPQLLQQAERVLIDARLETQALLQAQLDR